MIFLPASDELEEHLGKRLPTMWAEWRGQSLPCAFLSKGDGIKENFPSRSAKLRYIVKTKDIFEFDTDVFDKFNSLIEIENIGNKL